MKPVTMQDLAPLEALFDPAYPETLRDFATSIFMQLLEESQGLPPDPYSGPVLAGLALRTANRLGRDHGGRSLYFAKGVSFQQTLRNREMYALYDGKQWNYKTLGIKFDLSDMQVRNIIDACINEERAARQLNLPGLDMPQDD